MRFPILLLFIYLFFNFFTRHTHGGRSTRNRHHRGCDHGTRGLSIHPSVSISLSPFQRYAPRPFVSNDRSNHGMESFGNRNNHGFKARCNSVPRTLIAWKRARKRAPIYFVRRFGARPISTKTKHVWWKCEDPYVFRFSIDPRSYLRWKKISRYRSNIDRCWRDWKKIKEGREKRFGEETIANACSSLFDRLLFLLLLRAR